MESPLLLLVLVTFTIIHTVKAQDQAGFISLDCGLSANEQSPYNETYSGLTFYSDEKFIQSGKTAQIQQNLVKPYTTIRYFPDGIRNCYNMYVEKGRKYLIRASFVYGNYDGRGINPEFDLYLGPNEWGTIVLETGGNGISTNILHIPISNSLQICLVKTGKTTPLISALELRPIPNDAYITKSGSLERVFVSYLSKSSSQIRYSNDVYDRIWQQYLNFKPEWTQISTTLEVNNFNKYAPPKDVLVNAATPTNTSAPLTIEWFSQNSDDQYYFYAHFAEIQDVQANETREFNVVFNGEQYSNPLSPLKLKIATFFNISPRTCNRRKCSLQLIRTNRSTLPPLLNAFEVYKVIQFPHSPTNENDVVAIKNIEATYGLSRINWQGDPCLPQQLRWDALNCSSTYISTPPRITWLNLSSSGLTGNIAAAIQNLTQLEKLDLSNNNLTGGVPEFLGNMKSLSVLNLSGNNFNGSLPQPLQRKGLELFVEGNPRLCLSDSCRKPTKKKVAPIVASVVSAAIVIVVLVVFLVLRKKKSTTAEGVYMPPRTPVVDVTFANSPEPSFDQKRTKFTFSEVIQMTKNFQRVLGKGGFGMVYHDIINGSQQVAVKLLSQSSTQGYKQFKAEVDLLLRVHHTNLVNLVGYCYEEDHLALIYEFLPNGDLKQHLSGKAGRSILNWSIRLHIALEAALGLEYLHNGCKPPMVHRDVKTSNILLDEEFKAKLADFGLSRSFPVSGESHVSTVIAGTPGYLDPEAYRTSRLGEKSDVYSFGIVLLEIITNQAVISQTSEKSHITQWVGLKLNQCDITEIMDQNLCGVYDSNSAWRALELAMSCTDPSSSKRPTMSQVIHELKECILCENSAIEKNGGLKSREVNINLDTLVAPMAR